MKGVFLALLFSFPVLVFSLPADSLRKERKVTNSLYFNLKDGYVAPTNLFLRGANASGKPINHHTSYHLKYSFQPKKGSWQDVVYGAPYQGLGVSYTDFYNKNELGRPWSVYFMQGARLCKISENVSLNYEWNFGVSGGWKPFNRDSNPYNVAIGSKINAYIGGDIYFKFMLSKNVDLNVGVAMSHYSNGNTKDPNNGVNTFGLSAGVQYKFNPPAEIKQPVQRFRLKEFPRHMTYEIMGFTSWKDVTVDTTDTSIKDPYLNKKFLIGGLSFAPMYAITYRFRIGGSLDIHYSESAGSTYRVEHSRLIYTRGDVNDQISIGLAARADYVMPFFTISASIGYDVLHADRSSSALYQSIALKVNVTKRLFVNIGYRITNFQNPDFLQLGVGFKFSKYR